MYVNFRFGEGGEREGGGAYGICSKYWGVFSGSFSIRFAASWALGGRDAPSLFTIIRFLSFK